LKIEKINFTGQIITWKIAIFVPKQSAGESVNGDHVWHLESFKTFPCQTFCYTYLKSMSFCYMYFSPENIFKKNLSERKMFLLQYSEL